MQPPSNMEFAVFMACLAALVIFADRVLSFVLQWRTLFAKPGEGDQRPVSKGELDQATERLERELVQKIDAGGAYVHETIHKLRDLMNDLSLQVTAISVHMGLRDGFGRLRHQQRHPQQRQQPDTRKEEDGDPR